MGSISDEWAHLLSTLRVLVAEVILGLWRPTLAQAPPSTVLSCESAGWLAQGPKCPSLDLFPRSFLLNQPSKAAVGCPSPLLAPVALS